MSLLCSRSENGISYVNFPQAPFARAPFGECRTMEFSPTSPASGGLLLPFSTLAGEDKTFSPSPSQSQEDLGAKTTYNEKTRKQNFHARDLGGGGHFAYVFFSLIRNDPKHKHVNKLLPPTQTQDNPGHLFMFMCFFFPS